MSGDKMICRILLLITLCASGQLLQIKTTTTGLFQSSECLLLSLYVSSTGSFVVNVTQTSCQAEANHNITLEWAFTVEKDRSPRYLNIYCDLITDDKLSALYRVHNGAEVSESQDEKFSGRVQGDKDALREGRIRLQLCRLRTEDSGRYRCQVNTDYGFSSASCRLNVTAAADQRSTWGPTSPPQEERDWKIILIVLTAAVLLLALIVCTLLWVVLRKKVTTLLYSWSWVLSLIFVTDSILIQKVPNRLDSIQLRLKQSEK